MSALKQIYQTPNIRSKMDSLTLPATQTKCFHCGDWCKTTEFVLDEKTFCCQGCKLVYGILSESDLDVYYELEAFPGESQQRRALQANRFDYLQDVDTQMKLLDFQNGSESHVTFYIPGIHCASCIWLLENLYRLNSAVTESRVDFIKKKVRVKFVTVATSLAEIVRLLASIGYEPEINLSDLDGKEHYKPDNNALIRKLAVAGFCFGNMMLFSIPEYFSESNLIADEFKGLFNYLNVFLSLPIIFYSATGYYRSAWNAVIQRKINMDVPIVLGIIALFLYSILEIFARHNPGYMDSLGGLLFFLLLGKLYQQKTFSTLEFDRDYKSYFPIAVTRISGDQEQVVPLTQLHVGDVIRVRDEELIPADAVLLTGAAHIDYSFVTGEEVPVPKVNGELIYAGGRQCGDPIILRVQKLPSQGYLTDLWDNDAFKKEKEGLLEPLANRISAKFTWTILLIAIGTFIYWSFSDLSLAVKTFSTVLIVACPCALAMSTPFTLGNTLRIFGRNKFYLKNAGVIEQMALVDTVVFDKTGTLTSPSDASISYRGEDLSDEMLSVLKGMVMGSTHPLSNRISQWLGNRSIRKPECVSEIKGSGIEALYGGKRIRLGSMEFTRFSGKSHLDDGNWVFLTVDSDAIGCFHIKSGLRSSAPAVIDGLAKHYSLHLLSGDHTHELRSLREKLNPSITYNFNQGPADKLGYLKKLNIGHTTLMVGDGLNDAGALQESNVGIAITDQVSHFSPASDAILDAESFGKLPVFLSFAKVSRYIIVASFFLSFLYNIVGLSLAVQGLLSPVICAILMPLSSISVVVFTTVTTNFMAWKKGVINLQTN